MLPNVFADLALPMPATTPAGSFLPADMMPTQASETTPASTSTQISKSKPKPKSKSKSTPTSKSAAHLSLQDAILLALRNNPDVLSAQLTRVTDKYNVEIARNAFQPKYTLDFNQSFSHGSDPTFSATPAVALDTTMGTNFSVSRSNDVSGNGVTELMVTQPLLQGFGMVSQYPYLNALDNEKIAKINYRSSITSVVTSVIEDYRSLVSAELNLDIDKQNLDATEETTHNDELSFKAGTLAKSELIQQQATLASAKLSYQEQLNSVQTTYQSFLSKLGVSPWSKFTVDQTVEVGDVSLPSMEECIRIAFAHNPSYQEAVIGLQKTRRAVLSAKNDMKWSVNATLDQTIDSTGGTPGLPVVSGDLDSEQPKVSLSAKIPIDSLSDQSGVITAKVDYEEAKANLEQTKRDLIIQVQQEYQAIEYDKKQIPIGEQAVELQKMSLDNARLKFKYGKSTALDVATVQTSYVESESSLVSYRISLLNDITTFNTTLDRALDRWDIKLRY